MASRASWALACAASALAIGCGGGGGGGGGGTPPAQLAGTWTLTEAVATTSCAEFAARAETYVATVEQVGTALSVATPFGTFSGSVAGDRASWTGQGATGSGETLRITRLDVVVDASGFSGTCAWELGPVPGASPRCTGTATLRGVRGEPLPDAPTGLAAATAAAPEYGAQLTWNGAAGVLEYEVERSGPACASPWVVAGSAGTTPSYLASGLEPDSEYCFRVVARNAAGRSPPSAVASARTRPPPALPPATPASLSAFASSPSTVRLTWFHDGAGADGFRIYRRESQATGFGAPRVVGRDVRSVEDVSLSSERTYLFRVEAFGPGGDSPPAEATATTPPLGRVLPAPTGLSATAISGSDAALAWLYSGSAQSGFHVYRVGVAEPIGTALPRSRSFVAHSLRQSWAYEFVVRAFDAAGDSDPSNVAAIRMPKDIVGEAWTLSYRVTAGTCGTSSRSYAAVVVLRSGSQVTVDTGHGVLSGVIDGDTLSLVGPLTNGTVTIQITSSTLTVNADGSSIEGPWFFTAPSLGCQGRGTMTLSRDTSTLHPPTAPANVAATATSSSSIRVTWSPTSGDAAGFRIARGPQLASLAPVATVSAAATSFDDTGLAPGQQYFYTVTAYNADGDSPASQAVSATTHALAPSPPAAPVDLVAGGGASDAVVLTWKDASDDESGFRVRRALAGGAPVVVGTIGAGTTTWRDAGLAPDTSYDYRVTAYNAAGESAAATVTARTAAAPTVRPTAPSNLQAASVGATWVRLTWTDQSTNEDRFVVTCRPEASWVPASECATAGRNETSVTVDGLTPDFTYRFNVKAAIGALESETWATIVVTTSPPAGLTAPTGLAASATSSTSARLTWTDTSTSETGFRVYQATGGCGAAFVALPLAVAAGATSADVTGLRAGSTTCFQVSAVAGSAESARSASASVTLEAAPLKFRIVNDLANGAGGDNWGLYNGLAWVRIGRYRQELLGAECDDTWTGRANERFNPFDFVIDAADRRIVPPGAASPGPDNQVEFDVAGVAPTYCVYVQVGWWSYEIPVDCDACISGWSLLGSKVFDCDGASVVYKNAWFVWEGHTAGTAELRLSQVLPLGHLAGSSICFR